MGDASTDLGLPAYRRIAREIEGEIRSGLLKPDAQLATEGALAERFGVNRHTLRHAVDLLVDAGLVERRRGLGVFVRDVVWDYWVGKTTRFTQVLAEAGQASESRLLSKQTITAQGSVAERLAVAPGSPIVWIETLRLVDGRPFCVVSHYLPESIGQAALEGYEGGSLHGFLAAQGRSEIVRDESLITAQLPIGNDAMVLATPRTQPVLRVKSVNRDHATGMVVEYAITRFRADRVQLAVRI